MSLTRSMLSGMGLTAEQVSAIIEAHAETVDGLKAQRDGFKDKAEKYDAVLDENKKLKEAAGNNDWQEKFEKEHSDFEAYKADQAAKETTAAKTSAYKALLKEAGIDEKRIDSVMKVTDLNALKLNKDGKLAEADKLTESIKSDWADFVVTTTKQGAETKKPPETSSKTTYSADDIKGMSAADINANWDAIKASLK